jgi:hypothetical protein
MIDIFLTVLCFSGFAYASTRWLKIAPCHAPLFSISFIGILLFFFAIFKHLQVGASFLIFSGFVLSVFWVPVYLQNRKQKKLIPLFRILTFFLILVIISFFLTLKMTFTVVDDYVYWGIIGKYLYINNHLPVTGCPLDSRTLAYTPGTSLIHYFFYLMTGKYSVPISYFAQNIILICALLVVVKENLKKTIVSVCILIILMTLFSGSIFTKLQVDYLLSILSFSIFWIYYNEENIHIRLLTVSMPICFLFLIKEIGFVLGLFILTVMLFDILADYNIDKKNKLKALGFLFLTGAALFLLRTLWIRHVTAMGFMEFHRAICWESIKNTLHIFSDKGIQKGFFIFIKELIIGPADRLNIPYLFWYIFVAFLWLKILKTVRNWERPRFLLFSGTVFMSFLVYVALLYCLQIIIFQVGNAYDYTIGFSRYLNIVFSQIVFISVIIFFHTFVFNGKQVSRKVCILLTGVVLLVLGFSRLEVDLHREKQDIQIQNFSEQIKNKINNDSHSIGIITGKSDNTSKLQFLYHLLPNKVDYSARRFSDENQLIQYIIQYDYILLYNPGPLILGWLKPYAGEENKIEKISFLIVQQDKSENKRLKKFSLERILL